MTDDELTLEEHLDRLGGELDTLALLQDLYERDDVTIPWTTYVNPEPDAGLSAKTVLDTFEAYRADLDEEHLDELEREIEAERARRQGEAAANGGFLATLGAVIDDLFSAPDGDDSDEDDGGTDTGGALEGIDEQVLGGQEDAE